MDIKVPSAKKLQSELDKRAKGLVYKDQQRELNIIVKKIWRAYKKAHRRGLPKIKVNIEGMIHPYNVSILEAAGWKVICTYPKEQKKSLRPLTSIYFEWK